HRSAGSLTWVSTSCTRTRSRTSDTEVGVSTTTVIGPASEGACTNQHDSALEPRAIISAGFHYLTYRTVVRHLGRCQRRRSGVGERAGGVSSVSNPSQAPRPPATAPGALEGKVAVVTAAAGAGVGGSIVRRFLTEG